MLNDSQANDEEALYTAVGSIVINWGVAEQALVMISVMLLRSSGVNRPPKPRKIKALSERIEFIGKCFDASPKLAELKNDAHNLLSDFKQLKERRDELIHGAIISSTPKDGSYHFAKLDFINGHHYGREIKFDIKEYPGFLDEIHKLGEDSARLAASLMKKLSL